MIGTNRLTVVLHSVAELCVAPEQSSTIDDVV